MDTAYRLLALAILLIASQPDNSATISSHADVESKAEMISLPPYVIEANRGPAWKRVTRPDFEVLSRCSDELTLNLINRYERMRAMLALILPPALYSNPGVKPVLILDDKRYQPPVAKDLIAAVHTFPDDRKSEINFMPYLFFRDGESQVIYFVLEEYESGSNAITLTPSYLRHLLESRYPSLPLWLIEGMVTLQESIVMPVPPVGKNLLGAYQYHYTNPAIPYDEVRVDPLVWINPERTKEMVNEVKSMVRTTNHAYLPDSFPFLSLRKLLETKSPAALTPAEQEIYPFEAALFIRWALDPNPKGFSNAAGQDILQMTPRTARDQALWNFVALSSQQGMSEALFKQCFGVSTKTMESHLKGYLPFANLDTSHFSLKRDALPEYHEYKMREATDRETAILRGRLNRMAIHYVKQFYPELTPNYQSQARRTLYRTYHKQGDRDPDLLAEIGLGEVDADADDLAQPHLQTAVAHQVIHPRIYYELARINFQQLLSRPGDATDHTSSLDEIEAILKTGLAQDPQLAASYRLLFEIWLRKDNLLTADQLLALQKGVMLFQRDFRLLYAATLLQARQGNIPEARRIATTALMTFKGTPEETKIAQLLQVLTVPSPR